MTVLPRAFERAIEMQQAMEEAAAKSIVETPVGRAFLHDDYPLKYDLNVLRVERFASVEEVLAAGDSALQGFQHRKVHVYDREWGSKLAPQLLERGWRVDRMVLMVLDGQPPRGDRPLHNEVIVREITFEEAIPHWSESDMAGGMAREEAVMVAESKRVTADIVDMKVFGGFLGAQLASWCELYLDEGLAQIEGVGTHERFRKRGASTHVVTHAIKVATAAGSEVIFLVADDNDWPKEYYARLGFRASGYFYEFLRSPDVET